MTVKYEQYEIHLQREENSAVNNHLDGSFSFQSHSSGRPKTPCAE